MMPSSGKNTRHIMGIHNKRAATVAVVPGMRIKKHLGREKRGRNLGRPQEKQPPRWQVRPSSFSVLL